MDLLWAYFLVFILAATPWVEILLVIPAGLGMGLNPLPVAFLAFAGNAIPVFIIVYGYRIWQSWRSPCGDKRPKPVSRRRKRALNIWNRYGLPGLAFLGPLLTGIHLAVIIALAFKPGKKALLLWMNLSLFVWTAALTAGVYYGLKWI